MPEAIAAQLAVLEPSAQGLVQLLWHFHQEQLAALGALQAQLAERDAKLTALQAQNEKFRQLIFGRRSEKLPPISSEVRRAVEAEDFALDLPASATSQQTEVERALPWRASSCWPARPVTS